MGAYVAGSNPGLDTSIRLRPELLAFLRQDHRENDAIQQTLGRLEGLAGQLASDSMIPAGGAISRQ